MPDSMVTLYGVPHSLYTGRARSYLIKAAIAYRERPPTSEHFRHVVVPAAGGRQGLPTLELPDGAVIRDGAAIIEHFEAATGRTFSPTTPRQQVLSLLFDVLGAEGLLRPAMHYRWNFPALNHGFLQYHFRLLFPRGPEQSRLAERASEQMRSAARAFGVSPETQGLVEALYTDLLDALEQHFARYPYLLGNRPCLGDFGLIAPLFAHLGRDPAPLALMQSRAPAVMRWVERMNRLEPDLGAAGAEDEDFLPHDAVPETLIAVLKVFAEDFVPETLAAADCIDRWLASQPDLPAGTEVERGVGFGSFTVRDVRISALAQPYRFYLLARMQAAFAALEPDGQRAVEAVFDAGAMTPVLGVALSRGIDRAANLEIWS